MLWTAAWTLSFKRHAIGTPDRHGKGTPHRRWVRLVPVANRRASRAWRRALTSDGAAARGRCLFAHRGKPGWHSAAVLNKLRPAGVMVLSAVCPIRASRNLASGRRAPLCPVRDQRGEVCRNEERGVAVPRPGGTRLRLGSADCGKLLPWHGSLIAPPVSRRRSTPA